MLYKFCYLTEHIVAYQVQSVIVYNAVLSGYELRGLITAMTAACVS
jgi:hypothetical protein